jgi:AAHS family benzoate transporter-like MFS transporter
LTLSLPIHLNFVAFAIPGLIAALALILVPEKQAYYKQQAAVHEPKKARNA